jgi:hypothetical protein
MEDDGFFGDSLKIKNQYLEECLEENKQGAMIST